MSMGVFMPPPAPLMTGGGGAALDGMITTGSYLDALFGWSDGSVLPLFGSLSGDASPYFTTYFMWDTIMEGAAIVNGAYPGSVLLFQGETYDGISDDEKDTTVFIFGPEVSTWPTSGTHPFTLILP